MKGLSMTRAQAEAHQRKHGFAPIKGAAQAMGSTNPKGKASVSPPLSRMNKTESEYALILEAMKRRGEILRYEYEGITLRWADMKYTPDFIVFGQFEVDDEFLEIKLIEVKGGHIWDRDIVRFKGARAYWPEFQFELHQRKGGQWTRLH